MSCRKSVFGFGPKKIQVFLWHRQINEKSNFGPRLKIRAGAKVGLRVNLKTDLASA
jgi:hypothetical protein